MDSIAANGLGKPEEQDLWPCSATKLASCDLFFIVKNWAFAL